MFIETKYNIGDKVYLVNDRRIVCSTIDLLKVSVSPNSARLEIGTIIETSLRLKIDYWVCNDWVKEEHLFSTKEELLKSL